MKAKDTFLWRPPSDLKSRLEINAKEKGLSLTSLMIVISNAYLEHEEQKKR